MFTPVVVSSSQYSRLNSPNSFLQTLQWALHKQQFGWKAHYFNVEHNGGHSPLLMLTRSIKGVSIGYIPHPSFAAGTYSMPHASLGQLTNALLSHQPSLALVRWDLASQIPEPTNMPSFIPSLKRALVRIQPPDTTIVSLDKSNPELLAAMHPKTRYNIRLAQKKGITIRAADASELNTWYRMYVETARRDSIRIHSFAYYRTLFELISQHSVSSDMRIVLLFAEAGPEVLSGIIVLYYNGLATYLYGASSNIKRNWMPNYLLHWHSLQRARDHNCNGYDFFGIPPVNDPSHAMSGLYRFKVGFGGDIIHRVGAWDYINGLVGRAFRVAERLRSWYHAQRKHQ